MTLNFSADHVFSRMLSFALLTVIPACLALPIEAQTATVTGKPKQLNGQVHQTARVARPGLPVLAPLHSSAAGTKLDLHLDTSVFNQKPLSGQTDVTPPLETGISAAPVAPMKTAPLIESTPPVVPDKQPLQLSGGATKAAPRESSNSGSGGEPNYDYGKKAPRTGKKVLIRMKRFRSQQEMEVVWEAARVANAMARKGADVTILLDMEAVHAANKSDTSFASFEPNRGNGNTAAPRLTTPQDLLAEFVSNGGRVCVSLRWAKLYGMAGGGSAAMPGCVMLNDEEIADLLLESDNCIDY